jgi:hypothetical protein
MRWNYRTLNNLKYQAPVFFHAMRFSFKLLLARRRDGVDILLKLKYEMEVETMLAFLRSIPDLGGQRCFNNAFLGRTTKFSVLYFQQ